MKNKATAGRNQERGFFTLAKLIYVVVDIDYRGL